MPCEVCAGVWAAQLSSGLLQVAIFLAQDGDLVLEEHWVEAQLGGHEGHGAKPVHQLVEAILLLGETPGAACHRVLHLGRRRMKGEGLCPHLGCL